MSVLWFVHTLVQVAAEVRGIRSLGDRGIVSCKMRVLGTKLRSSGDQYVLLTTGISLWPVLVCVYTHVCMHMWCECCVMNSCMIGKCPTNELFVSYFETGS